MNDKDRATAAISTLSAGRPYSSPNTLAEVAETLCTPENLNLGWRDVIAFNEFSGRIVARRPPPWSGSRAGNWTDAYDLQTTVWLNAFGRCKVGVENVRNAIVVVAHMNRFHPVREYLQGLVWDGAPRLDTWLSDYLGAADTELNRAYASTTLIGAVARIQQPGCKLDDFLILEGDQGIGKSSALAALCPQREWFHDSVIQIGNEEGMKVLKGKWIVEIAELSSFSRKEAIAVRSYMSSSTDSFRDSYGRHPEDHERQNIFAGTTNEDQYVSDVAGERRMRPVKCTKQVDIAALQSNRDQLWAEAYSRYEQGEPWHLPAGLATQSREATKHRLRVDDWKTLILQWLNAKPTRYTSGITTAELLVSCLTFNRANITHQHTIRVGQLLRSLGFDAKRTSGGMVYRLATAGTCPHGKRLSEECRDCLFGSSETT